MSRNTLDFHSLRARNSKIGEKNDADAKAILPERRGIKEQIPAGNRQLRYTFDGWVPPADFKVFGVRRAESRHGLDTQRHDRFSRGTRRSR